MLNRIKEILSKPHILRAIVKAINNRKVNRIKPLHDELQTILTRLAEIENTKIKYMMLYEQDQVGRKLFSDRLVELENDLDLLHARRSALELELGEDHSQTVSFETVRSLIARFDQLLENSLFDQRKALMHLIIKKITVTSDKKIDKIELVFDEMTKQHFLRSAASAAQAVEGAFSLDKMAKELSHKLVIVI